MNPVHFLNVYTAETERLFRRATAIAGLILSAAFGLFGPILIALLNAAVIAPSRAYVQAEMVNPGDAAALDALAPPFWTWDWAIYTAYYGRNFMFLPILIFLLGGLSMASEFASRTTREDALRPMPRTGIMLAKWGALITWIVAASGITAILSTIGGLLLCGGFTFDETALLDMDAMTTWETVTAYVTYVWSPVAAPVKQIATTFLTDLGFASLALCIAVITRSVAATVASLVMLFVLQVGAFVGLAAVTSPMAVQVVTQQTPWLTEENRELLFAWLGWVAKWQPPFVIGNCNFALPTWEGFITLGVLTVLALVAAVVRFETMDVP